MDGGSRDPSAGRDESPRGAGGVHGGQAAACTRSPRGNCLDNAPMESFFASLKKEQIHHARFRTREEAKAAVFAYIELFYNRQRLHSSLGYRTPAEARADMEGIGTRAAA